MNIGMLWFDNDPKVNLDAKVERAASYYRNKYHRTPTLCFVHPSMMPAMESESKEGKRYVSCGVEIRGNQSVLPNHFWIGVDGNSEKLVVKKEIEADGKQ